MEIATRGEGAGAGAWDRVVTWSGYVRSRRRSGPVATGESGRVRRGTGFCGASGARVGVGGGRWLVRGHVGRAVVLAVIVPGVRCRVWRVGGPGSGGHGIYPRQEL